MAAVRARAKRAGWAGWAAVPKSREPATGFAFYSASGRRIWDRHAIAGIRFPAPRDLVQCLSAWHETRPHQPQSRSSSTRSWRACALLVERLEGGNLTLEEGLGCFEEGMRLCGRGAEQLDQAEKRVEVLLSTAGGGPRTAPLAPPPDHEDNE